jgi:hypothetical protein
MSPITKTETPVIEMYDTPMLASILKVSESQLEKARSNDNEPRIPFVRIGKSVRYPAQAVAAWIDANLVRQ